MANDWQSVDKQLYEAEIDAFRQGRFGISESIRSVRQELAGQATGSQPLSGQNDDKRNNNQTVQDHLQVYVEEWLEKMWQQWKAANYLGDKA